MALFSFSTANDDEGINEQILRAYAFFLANKAGSTILNVVGRINFHFFGTISFHEKALDEPAKRIGGICKSFGSAR